MPITYDIEKDSLYQKGFQKGLKIGFQKGFQRRFKKGFNKGFKKAILAIKCLKKGKTIKETAIITGLPKKKVKEIKELISQVSNSKG